MAVAAMTIACGGGCTTCVEMNLHWHSTRVDGGMCSCGTPQSGSDITGLVSPGFVRRRVRRARGWGGGLRGRCDRVEHAATAEERAVCMACCSGAAPDPRAATSRDDGGQTIGFRRTARRRLRRAVHEEPSDGSRMRWRRERRGRRLRSSSVVQCGGGRGDDDVAFLTDWSCY